SRVMNNSPTMSVVMPTFSAHELLEKNLPSIEKILRLQDELIIIDDASQDDTVLWLTHRYQLKGESSKTEYQVLSGQTATDSKVKVIVNSQNVRFSRSCNRGVEEASGELVFLLNNDVQPEPDI